MEKSKQQKNRRLLFWLILCAIGMFAFGYGLVPLYDVMCKTLGIGGKTFGRATESSALIDKSRWVEVQFVAHNNSSLRQWVFHPLIKKIKVHPGESKRIDFFSENTSNRTVYQHSPLGTIGRLLISEVTAKIPQQ